VISPELDEIVREIRERGFKKFKGRERAIAWRGKDFLDKTVDCGVIILPTRGCEWGRNSGCTMCGYVYDSAGRKLTQEEILNQFSSALSNLNSIEYLKIFNSGSFFDGMEIAQTTSEKIFEQVNNRPEIRRVQVESRPEFLTHEILRKAKEGLNAELEIGVGLETTNDYIRVNCINKGFLLEDFKKATNLCKELEVQVKAYLLIKPPFLTEKEAIEDAINSGIEAERLGVSRVSFNPVNIQKGTLVELLWKKNEYRAPWLWSIVKILENLNKRVGIPVLSHPTAAGKKRGTHNCGKCDSEVYDAIITFSITQDSSYLTNLECECKERWKDHLELEQLSHGTFGEYL
jgi:hypothetical protein